MELLKNIKTTKKSGNEKFIGMEHNLLEYWSWAHSDIASNAERGKLAEYIVSCALKSRSACRTEWDAVDVISSDGIKVEVKSSAYLQTWKQNNPSNIRFDIAPKNSWHSDTNTFSEVRCRSAEVYVFCVFANKNAETANPLDLNQWEFYVLSTSVLDEQMPLQKTAGLSSLLKLGAQKTDFQSLHFEVKKAAKQ